MTNCSMSELLKAIDALLITAIDMGDYYCVGSAALDALVDARYTHTPAATEPIVVTVPHASNARMRDEYTEQCPHCLACLRQELDACPGCASPVEWIGSKVADRRAKRAQAKEADAKAALRRRKRYNNPIADYLMRKAHETGKGATLKPLTGDELRTIDAYVSKEGVTCLLALVDTLLEEGRWGAGLHNHFMNILNSGKGLKRTSLSQGKQDKGPAIRWD